MFVKLFCADVNRAVKSILFTTNSSSDFGNNAKIKDKINVVYCLKNDCNGLVWAQMLRSEF